MENKRQGRLKLDCFPDRAGLQHSWATAREALNPLLPHSRALCPLFISSLSGEKSPDIRGCQRHSPACKRVLRHPASDREVNVKRLSRQNTLQGVVQGTLTYVILLEVALKKKQGNVFSRQLREFGFVLNDMGLALPIAPNLSSPPDRVNLHCDLGV